MNHTHPGDRLTFGCPACILNVKRDQRLAEIAEQPEQPVTFAYEATAHHSGDITVDLRYLPGEDVNDVIERNIGHIENELSMVVPFSWDEWDYHRPRFGTR